MAGGELGSGSAKSEPNVVPLCDILLVLLIIFMVVTPMIQKGANVRLPEARNVIDQKDPGQLVTVHLKRDGTVFLDDKPVDELNKLAGLIEDLMEEKSITEKKVQLKADVDVEYGRVVDVMNEIKNAQIEILALITEKFAATN